VKSQIREERSDNFSPGRRLLTSSPSMGEDTEVRVHNNFITPHFNSLPQGDCVAMCCWPFDARKSPLATFFKEGYCYGIVRNYNSL
jgi:hypothetical protein